MRLKWDETGIKSPLARAEGVGAAGHGAQHWIRQRVSAIANIGLMMWFTLSIASLLRDGTDYTEVVTWLATGITPVLMILTIISVFYHAMLGIQIVIEDYVHAPKIRIPALILIRLVFVATAVLCLFSVLKLSI